MTNKQKDEERPGPTREDLGRLVRKVWIEWAREQPTPKPTWLAPWEELTEAEKDVDRRIGETLFVLGMGAQHGVVSVPGDDFYDGDCPAGHAQRPQRGRKRCMSQPGHRPRLYDHGHDSIGSKLFKRGGRIV